MAIPDGQLYNTDPVGAGMVSGLEIAKINRETASDNVRYGLAVTANADGTVKEASNGDSVLGVAVRRTHSNTDHLVPEDVDANAHWEKGETFSVLREGIIAVPVTADVTKNQYAEVDTDGFKPGTSAGANTVGIFLDDANQGDTVNLQVNPKF